MSSKSRADFSYLPIYYFIGGSFYSFLGYSYRYISLLGTTSQSFPPHFI